VIASVSTDIAVAVFKVSVLWEVLNSITDLCII
jgi:hypothetical protein